MGLVITRGYRIYHPWYQHQRAAGNEVNYYSTYIIPTRALIV
jgi:hypothetical protein